MPRERSAVNILVKYFLFFENFLIWIAGMTITIMGAYILYYKNKVVKDAFDFFLDPSVLMCTAGSIIVFITFFGCMGALRENTCFLKTYNYILSFIFLAEIAVIVLVFVFYFVPSAAEQLGLFPKSSMQDAIRKYGIVDDQDMVNLIDNIQRTLQCCGLSDTDDGYLDWNENLYFNCSKANPSNEKCSVPASCCKLNPGDTINILCGRDSMKNEGGVIVEGPNSASINTPGCLKALGDWINNNAIVLGGVMLGILLPQIFVMCVSRTLRDQIKIQKSKWNRHSPANDRQRHRDPEDRHYVNGAYSHER